ncbi:hypothetical protein F1880_002148 [Penicillium rolfsii]|nr:hypothetical protein F1880_002148 [Penicillium rolfsii]
MVGVISLGLSVCQGLNTYYSQYKSFHKDIQDVTSYLNNLNCILESLVKTIRQSELQNASFTAEPARIALDTIDQCNQKLKELEAMLQKCKEEVREIHEEERELIGEMECLVREFNSDYQRLSLPFETFLREHWCVRMHEVLAKKGPLSEEVKSQIRGIGVVLLESESEGED